MLQTFQMALVVGHVAKQNFSAVLSYMLAQNIIIRLGFIIRMTMQ